MRPTVKYARFISFNHPAYILIFFLRKTFYKKIDNNHADKISLNYNRHILIRNTVDHVHGKWKFQVNSQAILEMKIETKQTKILS